MLNLLLITWALFAGLLMTRITNIFRLPDVTAYLIVGVIIGPSVLGRLGIEGIGFIHFEEVETLSIILDVALGFIAFAIGNEFKLDKIKTIGKQAFIIGVLQAVITTIIVDIVLIIVHLFMRDVVTLPMAIMLGAIAAATAPAATLMVIQQYKAKGPVTNVLLPVVALDDAVGLIIFAISSGIASSLMSGDVRLLNLAVEPFLEIALSVLLGTIAAFILTELEKYFHSNSNRTILIIATIILTVAIAKLSFKIMGFKLAFSPLLMCMTLGTVFCNICPLSEDLMERSDTWSKPILVLFFVLSGAELNLSVFKNALVVAVGIIYVISRSSGKYFGARISANIAESSEAIKKYLGITLLPQAGVALGMSAIVAESFGHEGMLIRNITLFGVLIYELFGPTFTKLALVKAGEINESNPKIVDRREESIKEIKSKKRKKMIWDFLRRKKF